MIRHRLFHFSLSLEQPTYDMESADPFRGTNAVGANAETAEARTNAVTI